MILQIWSSIHDQQGSLQFLSLDITQIECQSFAEYPTELLLYNVSLFFFVVYPLPRSEDHWEKKCQSCNQEVTPLSCRLLVGFRLTNPFLVSAEQQLTDPSCHFKSSHLLKDGMQWHFGAKELVYPAVVKPSHLRHTVFFLIQLMSLIMTTCKGKSRVLEVFLTTASHNQNVNM